MTENSHTLVQPDGPTGTKSFSEKVKRAFSAPWIPLTLVLAIAGGYATWLRFARGLGASTNLTDEFPWGIWIGFDVLCGVGLAAGGFTICALVHILNVEKYRPLLRPAVLTAFIGYVLVVGGLMYDLGQPWRIWHPIVMWNPHSVMFEVGWCVMLYTTVLAAEVSIFFFERFKMRRMTKIMHALAFPLALLSVLLSMLHQSSLGSLFLIVPGRLHELWYTPFLPLLFFISAIGGGLAMVIVESNLSARGFRHELPRPALLGAARMASAALVVYLIIRFADLIRSGALFSMRLDDRATWFFLTEIVIGFVLPIIYFNSPGVLKNRKNLYRAAQLCLLGFVINRLNVSVTGFEVVSGRTYVPAWTEVVITFTIIAAGVWAVYFAERFLPVLDHPQVDEERWRKHVQKSEGALAWPQAGLDAR